MEGGREREQTGRFFTRRVQLFRLKAEAEKQMASKKYNKSERKCSVTKYRGGLYCWHFVRFEQVSRFTRIRSVPVPTIPGIFCNMVQALIVMS